MEDSELVEITTLDYVIKTVAIFLNSVGIYLLSQIQNTRTNQNMILMNLSSAEILLCFFSTVKDVLSMTGVSDKDDDPGQKIFRAISFGFIFTYTTY